MKSAAPIPQEERAMRIQGDHGDKTIETTSRAVLGTLGSAATSDDEVAAVLISMVDVRRMGVVTNAALAAWTHRPIQRDDAPRSKRPES